MNNKSESPQKPFYKRPVPIIAIVLFIALIAGTLYLIDNAESMIEDRILTELNKEFSPDSEWEIDRVDLRLFPLGLTLHDIRLIHNTPFQEQQFEKPTDALRDFWAESIEISGVNLRMLLSDDDEYKLSKIHINSPEIGVLFRPGVEIETDDSEGRDEEFNLDEFEIRNAMINVYEYRADENPTTEVKGLNLAFMDITYSETVNSIDDLVGYYALQLESFSHKLQDDSYSLELENIEFDNANNDLKIRSGKLRPLLTLQELSEKVGEEVDHFDVVSGPITIFDIDPEKFRGQNTLKAGSVEIDGLRMYISRDKNFPEKERTESTLPNVAFRNLEYAVEIDSVIWKNGLISYEEIEEGQEEGGRVFFKDIDIKIMELQNRNLDQPINVDASTKFMDESMLNVDFMFTLDEDGRHTVKGELASIDLTTINQVLEPLAFIRISDGKAHGLTFEFEANDSLAIGEMILIYEDLNIDKLNSETLEQSFTSRIASFVANLAVIESSNTEDDPRVGKIEFEREKERSMFSYWWKTKRSGLKSSAGM